MARPRIDFGYQPLDALFEPSALGDRARRAESLGYRELFTSDHVGLADPLLPLVVAADATSTLRFGPLVLNNELHHPVLLARSAATFDAITGGRLLLGIGTGYMQSEHDATGIELRAPRDRVTRFGESLDVLRSLLDGGGVDTATEFTTVALDELGVATVQDRVPFLIGGHGRRVVGIAGRHADVFQFTGLTHDPVTGVPSGGGFRRADIVERHRWLRESAGERFGEIELSSLVQMTHVGDGADEANAAMAQRIGMSIDDIAESPFALAGSVAQIVEKIERLHDELGLTHFVVRDAEAMAPVVAAFS